MCKRLRIAHCAAASLLIMTCCGCAIVDQFSPRAVEVNYQTANAKSGLILLNIVRAAYAQPLQFTDVSTFAGTASIGATANATIPVPLNHPAVIATRTLSASPSPTVSAGGTVNIANLNTQEFYNGLQTPLTTQQVAYYLRQIYGGLAGGLSEYALLSLIISDIEFTATDGHRYVVRNTADTEETYRRFYYAIGDLLTAGLRVENSKPGDRTTNIGPELTTEEVKNPKVLAALIAASGPGGSSASSGSSVSSGSSGGDSGTGGGITIAQVKGKTTYQLQKKGSGSGDKYRFCFAPTTYNDPGLLKISALQNYTVGITIDLQSRKKKYVKLDESAYCDAKSEPESVGGPSRVKVGEKISISPRSVEGIIYFLGEMVRAELGLATGEETSLAIQQRPPYSNFNLFKVERRLPVGEEPWITYNGSVFAVALDPSGRIDASSRVLQLLTDLLALQSSAKNFPAPNLIAITP